MVVPYDAAMRKVLAVALALLAGCASEATTTAPPPTVLRTFADLASLEVPIGGHQRPLGQSGLTYERRGAADFDDTATPAFDAVAANIRAYLACDTNDWSVASQAVAVGIVEVGVHRRSRPLVTQGMAALDWGVRNTTLGSDGVFSLQRACDRRSVASEGGTHASTQWLAALGEAVTVLRASPYADELEAQLTGFVTSMEQLAGLLVDDANWQTWQSTWLVDESGNVFTHKTYLMAAGLGLTASVSHDPRAPTWARRAELIAQRGMAQQWRSGVDPERGGYDVLYQSYGTWQAELYYATLPAGPLRADLGVTIDRAIAWMSSRVDQHGRVEIGASSRVCNRRDGSPPFEAADTVRAFLTWGMVRADRSLLEWAVLIDHGSHLGNPCPSQTR